MRGLMASHASRSCQGWSMQSTCGTAVSPTRAVRVPAASAIVCNQHCVSVAACCPSQFAQRWPARRVQAPCTQLACIGRSAAAALLSKRLSAQPDSISFASQSTGLHTASSSSHSGTRQQGLAMDGQHVHILWSRTDQVDWSTLTEPWLASLPSADAQEILTVDNTKDARRARLLARRLQHTAISLGLRGVHASQQQPQGQAATIGRDSALPGNTEKQHTASSPALTQAVQDYLKLTRNKHGKPFLALSTATAGTSPEAAMRPAVLNPATDTGRACDSCPASEECVWAADLGPAVSGTDTHSRGHSTSPQHPSALSAQAVLGPSLQFNLSHTEALVGCVVAPAGVAVGLDVECLNRVPRSGVLKLARRRFSQAEVAALEACPDEQSRCELFMWLWTLKEAVVKARGTGISAAPGLKGFSVGVCPPPVPDTAAILPHITSWWSQHSDVRPLRITLDLTCTGPGHTSHAQQLSPDSASTSVAVPDCKAGGAPCGARPQYHLLLMQPSLEHIAALCVARPANSQCIRDCSATAQSRGSEQDGAPEQLDPQTSVSLAGLTVTSWQGVPGGAWQPLSIVTGPPHRSGQMGVLASSVG